MVYLNINSSVKRRELTDKSKSQEEHPKAVETHAYSVMDASFSLPLLIRNAAGRCRREM